MAVLQSLLIYDMGVMVLMLILSYLSRRLGEALKIRPWYRLLYLTTVMVFCAAGIDAFAATLSAPQFPVIAMALRVCAVGIAFISCLPYWNWLFSEYFLSKR